MRLLLVLLVSAALASLGGANKPVNVFFGGGGMRAAVGTLAVANVLKQMPIDIDEWHALSGGAWGTMYAQGVYSSDFAAVCDKLLKIKDLGPTSVKSGTTEERWAKWTRSIVTNIMEPVSDALLSPQEFGSLKYVLFSKFNNKMAKKVCFTLSQQNRLSGGHRMDRENPCDLCVYNEEERVKNAKPEVSLACVKPLGAPLEKDKTFDMSKNKPDPNDELSRYGHGRNSIGMKTPYANPVVKMTDDNVVSDESRKEPDDKSLKQDLHPITLTEALALTSQTWGREGTQLSGAAPPLLWVEDGGFIFSDGGATINSPSVNTIVRCFRSLTVSKDVRCPPMLLFDYSYDTSVTFKSKGGLTWVSDLERLTGFLKRLAPQVDLGEPKKVSDCVWTIETKRGQGVKLMYIGFCFMEQTTDNKAAKETPFANSWLKTNKLDGDDLTWTSGAFADAVLKYSQFLTHKLSDIADFIGVDNTDSVKKLQQNLLPDILKGVPGMKKAALEHDPNFAGLPDIKDDKDDKPLTRTQSLTLQPQQQKQKTRQKLQRTRSLPNMQK